MKVFALLAASTLAVASAQAPDCDLAKLRPLLSSPDGATCQGNTGYSVLTFSIPTGETLKKVCAEPTCKAFLATMNTAIPTECVVGGIPVRATIIEKFQPACDALAGSGGAGGATTPAPGPTTAAPGPTTAKPDATTAKPDATTAKPDATTAKPEATTAAPEATTTAPEATTAAPADGSTGSGSTDIDDVKEAETTAPAAKTTVPSPAPTKSSASSVAAAAGAIVVAVAASFF